MTQSYAGNLEREIKSPQPPRFEHRTVLVKGLGCDPDSANGGAKGMRRGRGRGGSSGKIG
ncbi:hypothetical protein NC651_025691 [Populus alba x Populus x berolinensis]|nr:hypothetical protein NC651_025691 [Populus alba x Populus x berolinensis]